MQGKKLRRFVKSEEKFRTKITNMLTTIEGKNPKEYWKLIKKMQNWGKPNIEPDSVIAPSEWLEHFQTLLNDGKDATFEFINELETLENKPFFSQLDYKIENREIEKALKNLNRKASPGVDNISGDLLFLREGGSLAYF